MKVTTDACILGALADFSGCTHLLDIGAGTGLLTLMQAQKNPKTTLFTAVEIDPQGFEELTLNCKNSLWKEQITCLNTDIRMYANKAENALRFDGIISNPPFFRADLKSPSQQRSKVRHEEESLSMRDFLACVSRLLSAGGKAYCLYPFRRSEEFESLLPGFSLYLYQTTYIGNNTEKAPHLFVAEIKKHPAAAPVKNTFYIREGNGYSAQMKQIISTYYNPS